MTSDEAKVDAAKVDAAKIDAAKVDRALSPLPQNVTKYQIVNLS